MIREESINIDYLLKNVVTYLFFTYVMGPIQKAVYEIISKKWLAYEITVAIGDPLSLSCFGLQIFWV